MIQRFKQMSKGYFRIAVVVNILAVIAWIAFVANDGGIDSSHIPIFVFVTLLLILAYWSLIRLYLWIYDGFQKDKAAKPNKPEAKN